MIGLVLEGGAMRGMFTAGVLDVMMESQTEVDGVIGVSAGATFGCNFVFFMREGELPPVLLFLAILIPSPDDWFIMDRY